MGAVFYPAPPDLVGALTEGRHPVANDVFELRFWSLERPTEAQTAQYEALGLWDTTEVTRPPGG